jgi:hypothetical protein
MVFGRQDGQAARYDWVEAANSQAAAGLLVALKAMGLRLTDQEDNH